MKESAQAFSYIRSRAEELQIDPNFHEKMIFIFTFQKEQFQKTPSAGITMATALISALTGIPVSKEVGMTGEITLRGRITNWWFKRKTLSAHAQA